MVVCCVNRWFANTEAFILHLLKVSPYGLFLVDERYACITHTFIGISYRSIHTDTRSHMNRTRNTCKSTRKIIGCGLLQQNGVGG